MKGSYKQQLLFVKQAAKDRANDYLMGQFEKSRKVLMDEFRQIIKQTEETKKIYKQYEVELLRTNDKLERQELAIIELN